VTSILCFAVQLKSSAASASSCNISWDSPQGISRSSNTESSFSSSSVHSHSLVIADYTSSVFLKTYSATLKVSSKCPAAGHGAAMVSKGNTLCSGTRKAGKRRYAFGIGPSYWNKAQSSSIPASLEQFSFSNTQNHGYDNIINRRSHSYRPSLLQLQHPLQTYS